jgi:RimJ/RimL family protein N-acetyltransferase
MIMTEISTPKYLFAPERYETPAFVLRTYHPGDGPFLSMAVNASYDHLRPWMPWAKPDQSVEESEMLARMFRANYLLSRDFVMGIWALDESRLLGGTGFHLRNNPWENLNAEIGMWIAADAAHKGLGTEVLKALLAWGFTAWPWQRITWYCDTRNEASAKVARKAGLRQEALFRGDAPLGDGSRRDTLVFALLKEEHQP